MGAHSDGVIDLARLNEVSMGDVSFEKILLQAFLDDAAGQLSALETAARKGSLSGIEVAAHSLKGAAANLGMSEVQNISAALERVNPGEDPEAAEILLRQLRTELDKITVFIKERLGE